jgi:hypothetical protein
MIEMRDKHLEDIKKEKERVERRIKETLQSVYRSELT